MWLICICVCFLVQLVYQTWSSWQLLQWNHSSCLCSWACYSELSHLMGELFSSNFLAFLCACSAAYKSLQQAEDNLHTSICYKMHGSNESECFTQKTEQARGAMDSGLMLVCQMLSFLHRPAGRFHFHAGRASSPLSSGSQWQFCKQTSFQCF